VYLDSQDGVRGSWTPCSLTFDTTFLIKEGYISRDEVHCSRQLFIYLFYYKTRNTCDKSFFGNGCALACQWRLVPVLQLTTVPESRRTPDRYSGSWVRQIALS
jgi:hypothetical protein